MRVLGSRETALIHAARARVLVSLSRLSVRRLLGVALVMVTMLALDVRVVPASGDALAKVGPELQALYQAYLAGRTSGQPLVVPNPLIRVVEDRVMSTSISS